MNPAIASLRNYLIYLTVNSILLNLPIKSVLLLFANAIKFSKILIIVCLLLLFLLKIGVLVSYIIPSLNFEVFMRLYL